MIAPFLRFAAGLAMLCGLLPQGAARACSPPADYRVPSNFELVQRADLIAIALVVAGPELDLRRGESADQLVQIAPMQLLKGVLPAQPLALDGIVGANGTAFEAMPTPLTAVHFSALTGACTRQYYAKGSLVLAMFEKTDRGMRAIAAPFARAVEDVESFDSLWVRTARRYVDLQQRAGGASLRAAVVAERDRLRAEGADMEAQAVAADLNAWLEHGAGTFYAFAGWNYDDALERISLSADGPAQASLICRRDGRAVELAAEGVSKPARLGLVIGARSLATDGTRRAGARGIVGDIAFTPEIDALLKHSAGPFAITVDGKPAHRGPGSDIFQKFAMRCETLLRP